MDTKNERKPAETDPETGTTEFFGVGSYGLQSTDLFLRVKEYIPVKNARVLVIGSEAPWLEGAARAAEVVTLEYGRIDSQVPQNHLLSAI